MILIALPIGSVYSGGEGDHAHPEEAELHDDGEEGGHDDHDGGEVEGIRLSEEAKRNIELTTQVVEERMIEKIITANGVVKAQPHRLAQVSPKVDAIVEKTLVEPWDWVKKGQVLVWVRSRQFGNPPPLLSLTAPISGLISKWDAKVGEAVGPGKVLFEIVDASVVWVEGDIPEHETHLVKVGQKARVNMIALPNQVFTGRIVRMGGMVEPDKRTVHVWVEVVNPDNQLKPEMFSQLHVVIENSSEVLAIPRRALLRSGGEIFVYVEQGDQYLKQNVVVGLKDDRYAEIIDGLLPGDVVVTRGNYQLMSSIFIKGGVSQHGH